MLVCYKLEDNSIQSRTMKLVRSRLLKTFEISAIVIIFFNTHVKLHPNIVSAMFSLVNPAHSIINQVSLISFSNNTLFQ